MTTIATSALPAPTETRTLPVALGAVTHTLDYPHTAAMEGAIKEVLQEESYPYLAFLNRISGAIVDIGANVGAASVLFSLRYPGKPIFAFEPSRTVYRFLAQNAGRLPTATAFNYGLYGRDCVTRLYTGPKASVTSSISESSLNADAFEEVELRRASTAIAELEIDRIALLKIDTEGAEVPILRDLEHRLDRVDAICLEYHSEADRLEIDHLLTPRFQLFSGTLFLHRGNLTYVSREVIEAHSPLPAYAIPRPTV